MKAKTSFAMLWLCWLHKILQSFTHNKSLNATRYALALIPVLGVNLSTNQLASKFCHLPNSSKQNRVFRVCRIILAAGCRVCRCCFRFLVVINFYISNNNFDFHAYFLCLSVLCLTYLRLTCRSRRDAFSAALTRCYTSSRLKPYFRAFSYSTSQSFPSENSLLA